MSAITYRPFEASDEQSVIDFIVSIQRGEFDVPITAEDQPDLRAIPTFYQTGAGQFLVAEADGRIVGTIALRDIGGHRAALRKMFVAPPFRGRDIGVAQTLLDRLLGHARANGIVTILLGTIERFIAAHRFYEKAGFRRIAPEDLPGDFPRVAVDTRFYRLDLQPQDRTISRETLLPS